MNPYFMDFEASSLSWDSYSIEIAWGSEGIALIMMFLFELWKLA